MKMPQKSSTRLLAATLPVLALTLAGCQSGQIRNNVMNSAQENDLGRDYASQIDTQVKFVMDGKVNRRVLDIATPIFAQAQKERPDVSFRVRVIDSPEVNAFSIPGGYVYIYRGLMDKIGNDDDALACVIGHESAHVVRRHVVKSISDSENKGFLVDLVTALSRSNVVGQAGGALFELDQLHYSREAEADRWGRSSPTTPATIRMAWFARSRRLKRWKAVSPRCRTTPWTIQSIKTAFCASRSRCAN